MPLTTQSAARKDHTTVMGSGVKLEHRHFAFIAAVLASAKTDQPTPAYWEVLCENFANACQRSNPRFDRARFLAACNS